MREEFYILDTNFKAYKPEEYKYKENEEAFKLLVEKEALKKEAKGGQEPSFIKYANKFGIQWEPMSDAGHVRFAPPAALMCELYSDYSWQLANSLGIPVYSIKGTNMFNLKEKAVGEHAKLFGDRLYDLEIDKRKFVMRYAACHQQFAMIKDWIISYKNMPFGAYEFADSYRFEQSGELLLLFRTRRMDMPDLHIFCQEVDEARKWCIELHKKIYAEFNKIDRDLICLYNIVGTKDDFLKREKGFLQELLKIEKKPVLLRFLPEAVGIYYWIINVEHHVIDELKRPREIATWQIDIGNAQRFGISYMNEKNEHKHPVIVHTAILGTLGRYLFTLFDGAVLKGKNPLLPLWITPVQVRLCPVNDSFVKYCEGLAKDLSEKNIRVDVDDRVDSVGKKIHEAESDWIPYIVVVGEKEKKSKKLAVRFRETGKVEQISAKALIEEVAKKTKGYPFRPLPMPLKVSKRPKFVG